MQAQKYILFDTIGVYGNFGCFFLKAKSYFEGLKKIKS